MGNKAYADILAKAMQLLGKRVLLHWLDDEGEPCGTIGILTHVRELRGEDDILGPASKKLQLENSYASVDIGRVVLIEAV